MCPARRITSPIIARGGDIQSLNLPLASFMQRQDVVLSALDHAGARLQALSPLATLARGYAIVRSDGGALRDAARVRAGDALQVQLASGSLGARVEEVLP